MTARTALSALLVLTSLWVPHVALASGEQWEYYVAKALDDLNKPMKDPTNDCNEGVGITVLGRLGWELVTVYADSRKEEGLAKGTIALQPERPGFPRQGTFQFGIQTSERVTAVFKRPFSHPLRDKSCS